MKKVYHPTWNLKLIYDNENDPQISADRKLTEDLSYKFIKKWKDRDDYLRDPRILKQALDEYNDWLTLCGTYDNEGYYFFLKSRLNEGDPKIKALVNKITNLSVKIANDIQFFTIRISKIPKENRQKLLANSDLKEYRYFLESLFKNADYLLSEPEEKIMSLKSTSAYSNWVKMLSGFLSKETAKVLSEDGKMELKTYSEIQQLLSHHVKSVRDSANKALNKILTTYSDVAENELNSILHDKKVNDELRKFPRPDSSRHINDDIETEIVDALVFATTKRFEIPQKYYELKAKLLGVEKLKYHERNVPVGDVHVKYTFDDSVTLLNNVFANIDSEFKDIFEGFLSNSQLDVFPKENKSSGAFCAHSGINQPTYILLNHTDKLKKNVLYNSEFNHFIDLRKGVSGNY